MSQEEQRHLLSNYDLHNLRYHYSASAASWLSIGSPYRFLKYSRGILRVIKIMQIVPLVSQDLIFKELMNALELKLLFIMA